jgi:hypothetical protein
MELAAYRGTSAKTFFGTACFLYATYVGAAEESLSNSIDSTWIAVRDSPLGLAASKYPAAPTPCLGIQQVSMWSTLLPILLNSSRLIADRGTLAGLHKNFLYRILPRV